MVEFTQTSKWPAPAKPGAQRSLLAEDLVIDGDVASTGPVEVRGKVRGQVSSPDLLISLTARIEGPALADALTVQGHVSGTVDARAVSLAASAVVHADIIHASISIEAGAEVEGQLKRVR